MTVTKFDAKNNELTKAANSAQVEVFATLSSRCMPS